MKICVAPKFTGELPPCDIALLGYGCLGDVNFDSELSGASDKLGSFARLTRRMNCAAVGGCRTDSRGLKRKSAAVAEGGRLLGITDMLYVEEGEEYKSGAGLGLYTLGGYKVGICIEGDICYPENFKSFSMCGCNAVLCLAEYLSPMSALLIRSYAYLYGMPFVLCAGGCACFADVCGGITTSPAPATIFSASPRNNYRLVTARLRGGISGEAADY